ncbi:unnamed protein product [Fusarium venenatum]|uniref:Uncharacterized protein n=1 Tax=Fusarium venenatum TaxID=56646 RepID=A0A2L2TT41_9HYPO|nr:uncharacterized protein FVRRES_08704 [Fusarium venenatum]CEI68627.1 unnamed protein product [Fusarium venenatum]
MYTSICFFYRLQPEKGYIQYVQCPPCARASTKLHCIQCFELQTTKHHGIVSPETENLTPSSDIALNIDTPKSIYNHLFHRQKLVHSSQAT